jgi:hypothetical protein
MLIKDAIREANTEHEIFFLLTAYVEALGYCDKLNLLPWQMRDLPVAGADDVKARVYGLHLRLHGLTPDSDTAIRSAIHEALEILNTALRRLASLQADVNAADLSFAA